MTELREFIRFVEEPDGTLVGGVLKGEEGDLFGGYVIAAGIAAACHGQDATRRVLSIHGYFLRPALATQPLDARVEVITDGRSFATRRVVLHQNDKPVFSVDCLFGADTDGGYVYDQPAARPAPPVSSLDVVDGPGPWLVAPVGPTPARVDGTRESTHRQWVKVGSALPEDPHLHAALLGYAPDWTGSGGRPLNLEGEVMGAMVSLDHTAWFHRPARADEWLWFDVHSLVNAGGRGLLRGVLADRDGNVVASVAQEMLLTVLEPEAPKPSPLQ